MSEEQKMSAGKAQSKKDGKKSLGYFVAVGCSLTTKRGILSSGQPISEKDLSGGKKILDSLVKSGHVTKK